MERGSIPARVFALPSDRSGWLSISLALGVWVCFGLLKLVVAMGYRGGSTFWSNPPLAVLVILLFTCGIGGGLVALYAIFRRQQISLLVWASLIWGCLVLTFLLGELGG